MILPARVDLVAQRNGVFRYYMTLTDGLTGTEPDCTTWDFLMHVRPQPGQTGTPLLTISTASGISRLGGGQLRLLQTQAQIAGLPVNPDPYKPLRLFYDLTAVPPDTYRITVMEGAFLVYDGVTRP